MSSKPDFICIGAQKAGTTWLHDVLSQHPDIWLPPIKELHFFDELDRNVKTGIWSRLRDDHWMNKFWRYRVKSVLYNCYKSKKIDHLGWYLKYFLRNRNVRNYQALFADKYTQGKLCGEITPDYAVLSSETIKMVQQCNPDMKIIFLLRDPVDRALSHLKMVFFKHTMFDQPKRAFEELDQEQVLNFLEDAKAYGLYTETIDRWQHFFKQENVFIGFYDELKKDPTSLYKRICSFLNIDQKHMPDELNKVSNRGASNKIPEEINERLRDMFKSEIEQLSLRFSDSKYPESWNEVESIK